jgi:hypothetical protein
MRFSRIAGVAVLVAVFTGAATPAQAQISLTGITVNPQDVLYNQVTGVLTVTNATLEGTLGGAPFTTTITNFVLGPGHGHSCSVLDLELAPIHADLLGLNVDTSSICLTITAQQGQGILGDLLCGLAGGTLNLTDATAGLLSGLETILNEALGQAQNAPPGGGNAGGSVCSGQCQVLDVVLGPLTLKLLGVTVKLNNCSKGPVQVCVSGTPSTALTGGGLLGDVICGLAGSGGVNMTLQQLLGLIETLISSGQLGLG